MTNINQIGFWTAALRGIFGKCPRCGQGKLFHRYLKHVDKCSECEELLGHIKADDGPAWLTVLLVGHILAPFMLYIIPRHELSYLMSATLWPAAAILLILIILPISKGLFIAAIWKMKCSGSEE